MAKIQCVESVGLADLTIMCAACMLLEQLRIAHFHASSYKVMDKGDWAIDVGGIAILTKQLVA